MSIVRHVDETLEKELRQGPLKGVHTEIAFETPNSDWAARRSGLCVNVFLHSLEEDGSQRQAGEISVVDEQGVVVGHEQPTRYFRLGYALTVWGQSPRDEHSMLGTLLEWCVRTEHLTPAPGPTVPGPLTLKLRETPEGVESPAQKLWSGLGTPARPVLDLLITVPLTRPGTTVTTPPIRDLALRTRHLDGAQARRNRPGRPSGLRRNIEEIT